MQGNINIPDSTITTNLSFRQLVLMNMQQLTNFPYIEKDFDALTDYELLCLVVKFLNDVIANQNEQNDSITRMYESFLALQDYVNNTKDELEDAFNNLDDYVRNYFDNLDVQEEINNKLDKMLEDGVLEQIIEQFIQSTAIWCFDTVSDMKLATNLTNGSYAKTLGFYAVSDGGMSTYKIRTKGENETANERNIISLYNTTLVAELVIKDHVTPEQFGAYGDDTHDDLLAIQAMFDYGCNKMEMNKLYYISDTLFLSGEYNFLTGIGSIRCDHLTHPCLLLNVWNSEISINHIEGTNGIKLRATEESDHWIQYVRFKNMEIIATDKCVECERTTDKWINELHFEDVRFNGAYGFYFMGNYQNDGYKFINCGNEICKTAFIKAYNLSTIDIIGIRNAEAFNYTLIDIENECYNFNINSADRINLNKINLNPLVDNIGSITGCVSGDGYTRLGNFARCINGRFLLVPDTNRGKSLNATNDTYDFKDNETDRLLYNNIILNYVEGGHAYSAILPRLYYNFTKNVLTIYTYSSLNTLVLTLGNNTYNLSFTDGIGAYKVINIRDQIYVYKLPVTAVNPS